MVELPVATVALLALAAFVAGVIDAVDRGGGLITLPALLTGAPNPNITIALCQGNHSAAGAAPESNRARHRFARGIALARGE
jgi:uncharacterized membrane protein YfcA